MVDICTLLEPSTTRNQREQRRMSELKVVSMVCINGKWMRQEEVDPALFKKLLGEKLDYGMGNAGFVRVDEKGVKNHEI